MPILKAIRQLTGDFGLVAPGALFETTEEEAEALEARGLVERYRVPTKAMPPPENKMMPAHDNKRR